MNRHDQNLITHAPSSAKSAFLSNLPTEAYDRLSPDLELVDAPLGMPIYNPYEPIKYLFFPVDSILSIGASTASGQSSEVGIIGGEGASGIATLMGSHSSPHACIVQIAGAAYRLPVDAARKEFRLAGIFHDRILHFVHKLSVQISQTTLCNRLHVIDERLARWLLMTHDRIMGDELKLTQELIALMLGTSRVTVTQAATRMQDLGYIKYTRGRITILDCDGLLGATCECYKIVKDEYDREGVDYGCD